MSKLGQNYLIWLVLSKCWRTQNHIWNLYNMESSRTNFKQRKWNIKICRTYNRDVEVCIFLENFLFCSLIMVCVSMRRQWDCHDKTHALCQTRTETQEQCLSRTGLQFTSLSYIPLIGMCCHCVCYIGRMFCVISNRTYTICEAYRAILLC
jgi:hypothetical protein